MNMMVVMMVFGLVNSGVFSGTMAMLVCCLGVVCFMFLLLLVRSCRVIRSSSSLFDICNVGMDIFR